MLRIYLFVPAVLYFLYTMYRHYRIDHFATQFENPKSFDLYMINFDIACFGSKSSYYTR